MRFVWVHQQKYDARLPQQIEPFGLIVQVVSDKHQYDYDESAPNRRLVSREHRVSEDNSQDSGVLGHIQRPPGSRKRRFRPQKHQSYKQEQQRDLRARDHKQMG